MHHDPSLGRLLGGVEALPREVLAVGDDHDRLVRPGVRIEAIQGEAQGRPDVRPALAVVVRRETLEEEARGVHVLGEGRDHAREPGEGHESDPLAAHGVEERRHLVLRPREAARLDVLHEHRARRVEAPASPDAPATGLEREARTGRRARAPPPPPPPPRAARAASPGARARRRRPCPRQRAGPGREEPREVAGLGEAREHGAPPAEQGRRADQGQEPEEREPAVARTQHLVEEAAEERHHGTLRAKVAPKRTLRA